MTPDAAGIEAALAAWFSENLTHENFRKWSDQDFARALLPVVTQAQAEALRLVRQVEADMAEQALAAWRSADARRGLSDHAALEVHADALTRWSERFRMAFDGEDYRARADES